MCAKPEATTVAFSTPADTSIPLPWVWRRLVLVPWLYFGNETKPFMKTNTVDFMHTYYKDMFFFTGHGERYASILTA
jgi:hypothetical protein